jgi:plasmid maintenance system antidote protein VapI
MFLTESEMYQNFKAKIEAYPSQKEAAKALGFSSQHISDVLNKRREISALMAKRLGYKRVVRFKRFSAVGFRRF